MSPARAHRERLANMASAAPATPIASDAEGGQPLPTAFPPSFEAQMTPAREHRITSAVASALPGDMIDATGASGDPVAATIALRLSHDLRRLKQIQSLELKIAAKREMIGEYRAWCDAILASERANVRGIAAEVLPTMMVWSIDIGDWPRALELANHVIGCEVALPSRYQRSAPALVAEDIADAAAKLQLTDTAFPLDVLIAVEELVAPPIDMHDQIRAKLMKAIGVEMQRQAEQVTGAEAVIAAAESALVPLRRAQALDSRVGTKDRVKKLERTIKAATGEIEAARLAAEKEEAAKAATQGSTDTPPPATDTPPPATEPGEPTDAPPPATEITEQTGTPPVA